MKTFFEEKRKHIFTIFRILLTFFLLYIIFKKINFSDTIEIIKNSKKFYLFLSLLSTLSFNLLFTYKWQLALNINKVYMNYFKLLRYHFISLFIQNFLPSSIGGDLVKGMLAFKGNPKIRVASSLIISRIFGILSLIILANIAIFSFKNDITIKFRWYGLGAFFIFCFACFTLFNNKSQKWCIKIYNSIKINRLKKFEIRIFFEKINQYKDMKIIIFFVLLSFFNQLIPIMTCTFIFYSIGESLNIIYLFIYVPIITFISILPISLNGLGIREGLFYYFFHNLVKSNNIIFAFILLALSIIFFYSLIGAILFIFKRN